jgi:hypothetical protein
MRPSRGSIGPGRPVRGPLAVLAVKRCIRCEKSRHGMALVLREYCGQRLRRGRPLLYRVVSRCLAGIERKKGRKRNELPGGLRLGRAYRIRSGSQHRMRLSC